MRPPAVHATKTSGRADLRRLCAGPRATLPQRACCAGLSRGAQAAHVDDNVARVRRELAP
jgi:hypothetical protein